MIGGETASSGNLIRELAQRLGCSVDDILDMSIEDMWRLTLEARADRELIEARVSLLESIRDAVDDAVS